MFDAKQWQERAEQARIHAEQVSDPEVREIMLEIARAYGKLAQSAAGHRVRDGRASILG